MSDIAFDSLGKYLVASSYNEHLWLDLQQTYTIGNLLMPCCEAPAIPKTSPNGLQFFAHHSDMCSTSPESEWHLSVKESLLVVLKKMNIDAQLEYSGGSIKRKWKADIYFEVGGKKYAFEVQHSYQHLRKYVERQRGYFESNVQCYWILYRPRFLTLTKSIAKYRLKEEFNNVFPKDLTVSCGLGQIESLPVVFYEPDENDPVRTPGFCGSSIEAFVQGVLNKSFSYDVDGWKIRDGANT
ncbi:MAG: hypothetical protein JKY93_02555 [Gammaproteobacteria bacterium]|nr:hypothetical protein [Gammaproteobacteria bacterium]